MLYNMAIVSEGNLENSTKFVIRITTPFEEKQRDRGPTEWTHFGISYKGSLDNVQIYTRSLSAMEVSDQLAEPPSPPGPTRVAASTAYGDWTNSWFPGIYRLTSDQDGISNFGKFPAAQIHRRTTLLPVR